MTKTLIVPGLDGASPTHWQQWWATTDPNAVLVELSDPARPVPAVWEIELASMILRHPHSLLVGHSLGAVLIAQLLATWPHLPVRGALLVAPADTGGHEVDGPHSARVARIAQFGALPTVRLDVQTMVVASRNDPWMRFSRAADLARDLGGDLIDLGLAGHINVDSGFGPWPRGKELRDILMQATAPVVDDAPALTRRNRRDQRFGQGVSL